MNFKNVKTSRIIVWSLAIIAVACLYMWWQSNAKKAPGEGLTIVTPMPVSDYSIDDMNQGLPQALPETLQPVNAEGQPDVITQAAMIDDTMPTEGDIEEFANFASKNWRGQIL